MEEQTVFPEVVQPEELPASIRKKEQDDEFFQLQPRKFPRFLLLLAIPIGLLILLKLMILAIAIGFTAAIGFAVFRLGSRLLKSLRKR